MDNDEHSELLIDDKQFAELLSIVDRAAGRKHSTTGTVATALRKVLKRHAEMIHAKLAQDHAK